MHAGQAGIVYALSRKRVDELAEKLAARGLRAGAYHAGLGAAERKDGCRMRFCATNSTSSSRRSRSAWASTSPMCASWCTTTCRRTSRAITRKPAAPGRDGLPAEALLLFGAQDVVTARALVERGSSEERQRIELHKLNAMVALAESLTCRRRVLLGYFGERCPPTAATATSASSRRSVSTPPRTRARRLSCVYRLQPGLRHQVRHRRAARRRNDRIAAAGHDRLSTWGIGAHHSMQEWASLIRQLIHRGYLEQDIARYSVLRLTPAARPLLRGEETLELARPRIKTPSKRKAPKAAAAGGRYDETLFDALRALRKSLADAQGVPPYIIFGDATLVEMARELPTSPGALLGISGVGQKKLQRYGDEFLQVIRAHQ
jgi:ATP-dependent DNA helicase RecQ